MERSRQPFAVLITPYWPSQLQGLGEALLGIEGAKTACFKVQQPELRAHGPSLLAEDVLKAPQAMPGCHIRASPCLATAQLMLTS